MRSKNITDHKSELRVDGTPALWPERVDRDNSELFPLENISLKVEVQAKIIFFCMILLFQNVVFSNAQTRSVHNLIIIGVCFCDFIFLIIVFLNCCMFLVVTHCTLWEFAECSSL